MAYWSDPGPGKSDSTVVLKLRISVLPILESRAVLVSRSCALVQSPSVGHRIYSRFAARTALFLLGHIRSQVEPSKLL